MQKSLDGSMPKKEQSLCESRRNFSDLEVFCFLLILRIWDMWKYLAKQSFHLVLHNRKSSIKTFISKFESFNFDYFKTLIETFGLQIKISMLTLNFPRSCSLSFFFALFLWFLSHMSLNHSKDFFRFLQSLLLKILCSNYFDFLSLN